MYASCSHREVSALAIETARRRKPPGPPPGPPAELSDSEDEEYDPAKGTPDTSVL